jgi:DNA ligase (NAD+)
VRAFFDEEENVRVADRLYQYIRPEVKDDRKGTALAGKIFVLTGTMTSFTRQEAREKIESLGGRVTSTVSTKTDYVVAGADPGSKFDKARELGVQLLDERDFIMLLEGLD